MMHVMKGKTDDGPVLLLLLVFMLNTKILQGCKKNRRGVL